MVCWLATRHETDSAIIHLPYPSIDILPRVEHVEDFTRRLMDYSNDSLARRGHLFQGRHDLISIIDYPQSLPYTCEAMNESRPLVGSSQKRMDGSVRT